MAEMRDYLPGFFLALCLLVLVSAIVAGFSYLGLYQAPASSADLHVPINGLPSGCTAGTSSAIAMALAKANPVPPPSALVGMTAANVFSSCATFAVIAANETSGGGSSSVAAAFPLLLKLQKLYPLSQYSSHLVPPLAEPPSDPAAMASYVNTVLRKAVVDLDTLVGTLVQRKVSLIHLPSSSSLLVDAFLRGSTTYRDSLGKAQTVSFFNGRSSVQRYPTQRFSVSDTLAASVDTTANVLRFADVVTSYDPMLLLSKLMSLGVGESNGNSGVYVINQQGDLGSNENFARLASLLTSGAQPLIPTSHLFSRNLTFSGTTASGSFSADEVQALVADIDATIAALMLNGPTRLVIVLNPATHHAAQAAFIARVDMALAAKYASEDRVRFFALTSEATKPGPRPIPVLRGLQPVAVRPTADLAYLGFSSDPATLQMQVQSDLGVLDALKFAALCRTADASSATVTAVTGSPYKFAQHTIVAELLHDDGVLTPAAIVPANLDTGLRFNGRFTGRGSAIASL